MTRNLWAPWILVAAIAAPAAADIDTTWTRTYGGAGNEGFRALVTTPDGGFLAAGYTYTSGAGDVDVWVVKTDGAGNELWSRTYGGAGRDYGYGVCRAAGGGYAVTGYTTSFGAGREDVWLVRIDEAGDTLWTRAFGGAENDEGRSVCETPDGAFLVAGQTESFGAGEKDWYVLKVDSSGDTVWTRTHGAGALDYARGVCVLGDGNYGLNGSVSYASSNMDMVLMKMTPAGDTLWTRVYGDLGPINPEWATAVCADTDSGLVAVCYRGIEGVDPSEVSIAKVDAAGGTVFWRRWVDAFYEYALDVCVTSDGGHLIAGMDKDAETLRNDLLVLKRVPGQAWTEVETLGGPGADWGASVVEVSPGTYAIAGHTDSYGAGGYDGWLVLYRDAATGVEEPVGTGSRAFLSPPAPNPARGGLSFALRLPAAGRVDLRVLNVAGEEIRALHRGDLAAGLHRFEWDGRGGDGRAVSSGVYFIVASGDVSDMRRAVIVR